MRKILITGGAGFVGRHFVRHFLEAATRSMRSIASPRYTGGIDPGGGLAPVRAARYRISTSSRRTAGTFSSACSDTDFDYAFHLAAMVGGRLMIENNPLAVADDLSIDAAYWQWAEAGQAAEDRLLQLERRLSHQVQRAERLRAADRRT